MVDRKLKFVSLGDALTEAERLASKDLSQSESVFTLPQTLVHCAQSIEYSMNGFPAPKSPFFQNTIGSVAFNVFSWRGRMSHNLGENIPGAPSIDSNTDVAVALKRLKASIEAFSNSAKPLQPHFAYGQLNQSDYELAHIFHLANHFSSIDA